MADFFTRLNYQNIKTQKWQLDPKTKRKIREMKCSIPTNYPGCAITDAILTFEVIQRTSQILIIEKALQTVQAPYSDTFICKESWVTQNLSGSKDLVFSHFMKVEFVKETFFQSLIQSNAENGMIFTSDEWLKISVQEGYFNSNRFAAKDICNLDSCILANNLKESKNTF